MLGGYGIIHDKDIETSTKFLSELRNGATGGSVLDCGAGIGRVTRHLLSKHYDSIDLVEPSPVLIEQAK